MRHNIGFVSLFGLMISWVSHTCLVGCQKPAVVNLGAIFTFDSVIGRAAKPAVEAAISDINDTPTILNGTHLKLFMKDADCNVFMGSTEGN